MTLHVQMGPAAFRKLCCAGLLASHSPHSDEGVRDGGELAGGPMQPLMCLGRRRLRHIDTAFHRRDRRVVCPRSLISAVNLILLRRGVCKRHRNCARMDSSNKCP